MERSRSPVPAPLRKGLRAQAVLPLECFGEPLQTKVVVPLIGELLVLLVQVAKSNVLSASESAAPLL